MSISPPTPSIAHSAVPVRGRICHDTRVMAQVIRARR
jgi:hypothetical protein